MPRPGRLFPAPTPRQRGGTQVWTPGLSAGLPCSRLLWRSCPRVRASLPVCVTVQSRCRAEDATADARRLPGPEQLRGLLPLRPKTAHTAGTNAPSPESLPRTHSAAPSNLKRQSGSGRLRYPRVQDVASSLAVRRRFTVRVAGTGASGHWVGLRRRARNGKR